MNTQNFFPKDRSLLICLEKKKKKGSGGYFQLSMLSGRRGEGSAQPPWQGCCQMTCSARRGSLGWEGKHCIAQLGGPKSTGRADKKNITLKPRIYVQPHTAGGHVAASAHGHALQLGPIFH